MWRSRNTQTKHTRMRVRTYTHKTSTYTLTHTLTNTPHAHTHTHTHTQTHTHTHTHLDDLQESVRRQTRDTSFNVICIKRLAAAAAAAAAATAARISLHPPPHACHKPTHPPIPPPPHQTIMQVQRHCSNIPVHFQPRQPPLTRPPHNADNHPQLPLLRHPSQKRREVLGTHFARNFREGAGAEAAAREVGEGGAGGCCGGREGQVSCQMISE